MHSSKENVCIEMATISTVDVSKTCPTRKIMNESGCLLDNIVSTNYYCYSPRKEMASSVEDDVDWVKVEKQEERDGK